MIGIKVKTDNKYAYVTLNYRHIVENGWLNDLRYLCEPTEFHEKRVTVRFTSSIHFYKDITRHRKMSFAIESTRYCNYSKEGFNNELTFIIPSWCDKEEGDYGKRGFDKVRNRGNTDGIFSDFTDSLKLAEDYYFKLLKDGWSPQQAAEVLPQATKADIVMTGFISDYQHFFDLRTSFIAKTGKPHPDVSALADPLYEEFIHRNYIKKTD